jgi:hypothetical protein
MSRGLVSFMAGLGGGYLKAREKGANDERQARMDQMQQDRHNAWMSDQDEQKAGKRVMQDAMRPVEMQSGGGGALRSDAMDNRDVGLPENQALPNAGLSQQAYRVGGKSYATMQDATTATQQANSPDAQNQRVVQAYQMMGKPMEALSMQNAVVDSKLKALGLSKAEADMANEIFNKKVSDGLSSAATWQEGAAKLLTDTQVGGLSGITVSPVASADGKTIAFVGVGDDGAKKTLLELPNSPDGKLKFLQQVARVPIGTQMSFLTEQMKRDLEDRKVAADELRAGAAVQTAATGEKRLGLLEARMTGGGGGRGGGGTSAPGVMPSPMEGFDSKKAFSVATEQAITEFGQGVNGKPATPEQISRRATEIYRGLEAEFGKSGTNILGAQAFAKSARDAQTPAQIEALRQKGSVAGLTDEQMAKIDPRFAPPKAAEPTPAVGAAQPAQPKPGRKPITYVTMPGNPSEKQAQRMAAAKTEQQQRTEQALAAAKSAAQEAIDSKDMFKAEAVQQMAGFGLMKAEEKAAVRRVVFGK